MPEKTRHWVLTIFNHRLSALALVQQLDQLRKKGYIKTAVISEEEEAPTTGVTHFHVYVYTHKAQRRSIFGTIILNSCKVMPLDPKGQSLYKVRNAYLLYIKKKGIYKQVGEEIDMEELKKSARAYGTKAEQVRELVLSGVRKSEIIRRHPSMYSVINKLMELRPPRTHKTYILYIYGPTGKGKTTNILRALEAVKYAGDGPDPIDYYSKMSGMQKYWDGYDNQPIVWIDDPNPVGKWSEESAAHFKTVLSTGPTLVEVKHGSMQFDSHLVIISTNLQPGELAASFGSTSEPAILRRLKEFPAPLFVGSHSHAKDLPARIGQIGRAVFKSNAYPSTTVAKWCCLLCTDHMGWNTVLMQHYIHKLHYNMKKTYMTCATGCLQKGVCFDTLSCHVLLFSLVG